MRLFAVLACLAMSTTLMAEAAAAKTSPVAAQQVLDCTFVGGRVDWITDRLFIVRDTKINEITVYDAVIKHVFNMPIKANVVQDNANRLELDWVIKSAPGEGGSTVPVSFHATLLKGEMKLLEKAVVGGYDNKESRSGTCVPAK